MNALHSISRFRTNSYHKTPQFLPQSYHENTICVTPKHLEFAQVLKTTGIA